MKRFWLSWWQVGSDYRPLVYPVTAPVLGWGCSGSRDDASSLCALVEATNKEAAKAALHPYWPESASAEWRFCKEKAPDWVPGGRFPMPSE